MSPPTEKKVASFFVNKKTLYTTLIFVPFLKLTLFLPLPPTHTHPPRHVCSPSHSGWTRRVLKSLFPSWLPAQFAVMFSKPFPAFSSRLNAWVTLVASQWLMGPSQLNDIEVKKTDIALNVWTFASSKGGLVD